MRWLIIIRKLKMIIRSIGAFYINQVNFIGLNRAKNVERLYAIDFFYGVQFFSHAQQFTINHGNKGIAITPAIIIFCRKITGLNLR